MTTRDPRAVAQSGADGEPPQHEPRTPGDTTDHDTRRDHPSKPFRTPNKTKARPAPDCATDGNPLDHRKH